MGLRVATDMRACSTHCPALWQRFLAEAPKIYGSPEACATGVYFGLSYVTDLAAGAFEYVAAMPLPEGMTDPEGMEHLTLPTGLYARTEVPNLERIGEAYSHIYTIWFAGRADYAPNPAAPSFERYDERYVRSGTFDLYVPIQKKPQA